MADNSVFSVDTKSFEAANAALKEMQGSTTRTKNNILAVEAALVQLSKAKAGASAALMVDPKSVELMKSLTDSLHKVGIEKTKIEKLTSKELVSYDKLTKAEKARIRTQEVIKKSQERTILYKGKEIQLEKQKNKLLEAGQSLYKKGFQSVNRMGRSIMGMASSTTGLQFSLAGIVALLFDIYNKSNKIGAMSRQINAQWGKSATGVSTSSKAMSTLRVQYWKSVEAAGEIVNSLARGGVEEKNMLRISKDLTASELVRGVSIQEQFTSMKGVATGFNMSSVKAQEMLEIVRDTSKTIPLLSMSDAVADVTEMAMKSRSYNTSLADTLALYNTLMKKDAAKAFGLGDAPREVRKEVAKTIAGFGTEMGDGWKAALGEGATAASRILNFEKLLPEQKFKSMANFISDKTSGFAGDEKQIAVRSLLKQFGFASVEVQKVMAEAFAKGGFSAEGLSGVVSEVGAQRKLIEAEQRNSKANRAKLYKDAADIANGLTGLENKLKMAIDNSILGSAGWPEMKKNIDKIARWALTNVPAAMANMVTILGSISSYIGADKKIKTNRATRRMGAVQTGFGEESSVSMRYLGKEATRVGGAKWSLSAKKGINEELEDMLGRGGQPGFENEKFTQFTNFLQKTGINTKKLGSSQVQNLTRDIVRGQLDEGEIQKLVTLLAQGARDEARSLLMKQLTEKASIRAKITKIVTSYNRTEESNKSFFED